MNEQLFVKRLIENFKTRRADVLVGIGDDAAMVQEKKGFKTLFTCDSQVEGVHFQKNISPHSLAFRAVTAGLSDIAAMGGIPSYLLVSIAFPKKIVARFLNSLIQGFGAAAKRYQVEIVGGNITAAPVIMIDIFAIGYAKRNDIVLRSGARPGDSVLITGKLGKKKLKRARIAEGQIVAAFHMATAMIDISDGFSTDALRLCDASDVGIQIFARQLPVMKPSTYNLAVNRGEDYELCFTVDPKNVARLISRVEEKTGTSVTVIGEILKKEEGRWLIDEKGKKRKLKAKGWDHFIE